MQSIAHGKKFYLEYHKDLFSLITAKQSCMNLKIGNIDIENSTFEKLLRV